MKKLSLILTLLLFSFCCFSQSRYISETTKKVVYTRDGGKCQCCGSFENLEYDHIIPYSCGGSSYCKIHNKKVGSNCCDGKSNVNQSQKSSGTSSQCTGTTKKGARCRNMTTNSSGRCHLH